MTVPSRRSWSVRAAAVAALAVGAGALTLLPGGAPTASAAGLVAWGDCDALLAHAREQLARTADGTGQYAVGGDAVAAVAAPSAEGAGRASGTATESTAVIADSAVGAGPTGTNLQEAGVDEPDSAKLVGDLLLTTAGGRLQVLRAGAQPELLASLPLPAGLTGAELLVDGDRVLVVGSGWQDAVPEPLPEPVPTTEPTSEPTAEPTSGPTAEPGLPVEPGLPEPLPVDPGTGGEVPPVEPPVELPPATGGPDDPVSSGAAGTPPGSGTASSTSSSGTAGTTSTDLGLDVAAPALPSSPGRAVAGLQVPGPPVVHVLLVDVGDPRAPAVLEQLRLDGRYVSARLVGGTVRLVTSSAPQLPPVPVEEPYGQEQHDEAAERTEQAARTIGIDAVLPQAVRLGAAGEQVAAGPAVGCTDVAHAAGAPTGSSTLLVTTLRPADGLAAVDSTAVTTDGDLVYASADRLYVATSRWGTVGPASSSAPAGGEPTTELHAFDTTAPDRTRYVGSGSVPGYVYGRWALSEHEGDLRVATTRSAPWGADPDSASSVVVLAEQGDRLVERGRLDGLGRGERIYAVRYLGDLAAVVTFRQTDPLYVLDLSDPTAPRTLGELKVPGFSTYLHPVGDDRLLAVGQDADSSGRVTGFQLSTYDLTDLSRPTQVDRLSLGEAWSPASDDARAFSYDPGRRLAVLPLATFDQRTGASQGGALAVRVGEDFRLAVAGRLDVGPAGAERVLLGEQSVWAVGQDGVVAGALPDLRRTGAVRLPAG